MWKQVIEKLIEQTESGEIQWDIGKFSTPHNIYDPMYFADVCGKRLVVYKCQASNLQTKYYLCFTKCNECIFHVDAGQSGLYQLIESQVAGVDKFLDDFLKNKVEDLI